ncbi:MAG: tyrosine-type recombinase/integrase [Nodosilinea sp.]
MPRKKLPARRDRGAVHIVTRGRMLYLRWTYQGELYRHSTGLPDTPFNRNAAQGKAAQIERDIALERFDATLESYWPKAEAQPERLSTVALWERFMQHCQGEASGQTITAKYRPVLANLQRFGRDILTPDDARAFVELLASRQAPTTLNQNISLLRRGFSDWCIHQGHWESSPFESIKRVKDSKLKNPKRKPLEKDEATKLLDAFRSDLHALHYHDFACTLLNLGLRPSEGAELRWKDVDFQRNTVTIRRNLRRNPDGRTAGYARVVGPTKNRVERQLGLNAKMRELLIGRLQPGDKLDDRIFLAPKGGAIDEKNFNRRYWQPMCRRAGIDERVAYAARHTSASHALKDNTPAQVAQMLGDSVETVVRTYLHGVGETKMPEF